MIKNMEKGKLLILKATLYFKEYGKMTNSNFDINLL